MNLKKIFIQPAKRIYFGHPARTALTKILTHKHGKVIEKQRRGLNKLMDHLWAPWRMEYLERDKTEKDGCVFAKN